jgi:hypothetical protein
MPFLDLGLGPSPGLGLLLSYVSSVFTKSNSSPNIVVALSLSWFLVFGLWSLVFGLWSLVFGLWSLVFGLGFLVFGSLGLYLGLGLGFGLVLGLICLSFMPLSSVMKRRSLRGADQDPSNSNTASKHIR